MASFGAHVRHLWLRAMVSLPTTRSKILSRLLGQREFGLNGLDSRLIDILDKPKGFYVEIGANDGVAQSNTLQLELFHGWKGVLIEPIPATFEKLQRNRNSRRNYLQQGACVSFEYGEKFVELLYANLVSTPLALESDITDPEDHAGRGAIFLKGSDKDNALARVQARAFTMTTVLSKANAPQYIDFLSLDVEGAELEVLKGIDFDRYSIGWILVESRNFAKMRSFLEARGYLLHSTQSHHDYLFRLEA